MRNRSCNARNDDRHCGQADSRSAFAGRGEEMKVLLRTALVAAGFGLAVAALVPVYATAARAPSVDPDAAEVTIMGHRFRGPKVYLSESHKVVERTPEYKGDSVLMKAALPDLLPITKRDTEYYKWGEGFTDVITFHISAEPGHAGPDEATSSQNT